MSFSPIDSNKIKVGDPITKEILDLVKSNLDDLDFRVNNLALTGGSVYILNGDFSFLNFTITSPVIFIYKARQNFSINDFRVQINSSTQGAIGNLSFRLEKSNNLLDENFSTILNSDLIFNFATPYQEQVANLNPDASLITAGQILRIRITSHPVVFRESVLLSIGAE